MNPDGNPFPHDDCYVVCSPEEFGEGRTMREAATLSHDGLSLKVSTTAPSMHVYTGKWNIPYKDHKHGPYSGIAFEPERYVDAINWPAWRELSILKPGQEYFQETHYSVFKAAD
jgi:galactose mutarotase-like enzyme